ncbi:proteasome activator [Paeniglutamicibacter cryotolerans]|uniref:Bacterial proteasome activator n=1 Tax=Paeniglutamicibacter cryotolerans TaxID=670079 RepID=A0A839QKP3_9MICC|nr:proteasome activator [Paeniglutamicibacter cryotolerans]MBB2995334.1 hypothetical protein [Paeniglutamicibacter cryotolerans]
MTDQPANQHAESVQQGTAPGAGPHPFPAPQLGEPFQVSNVIGEPGKVMRLGGMVKQLLEEVKAAPLDEKARAHLADIHERSVAELESGLSPELAAELHRIRLPFQEGVIPSESELRIAQAQLVGWLEGVFHGLQAAMAAQQLANQQLAQRMQLRQLPPGTQVAPGIVINERGEPERMEVSKVPRQNDVEGGPGQYL